MLVLAAIQQKILSVDRSYCQYLQSQQMHLYLCFWCFTFWCSTKYNRYMRMDPLFGVSTLQKGAIWGYVFSGYTMTMAIPTAIILVSKLAAGDGLQVTSKLMVTAWPSCLYQRPKGGSWMSAGQSAHPGQYLPPEKKGIFFCKTLLPRHACTIKRKLCRCTYVWSDWEQYSLLLTSWAVWDFNLSQCTILRNALLRLSWMPTILLLGMFGI